MNEDTFNMSIRKFLKKVGVTSQREIEGGSRREQSDLGCFEQALPDSVWGRGLREDELPRLLEFEVHTR